MTKRSCNLQDDLKLLDDVLTCCKAVTSRN